MQVCEEKGYREEGGAAREGLLDAQVSPALHICYRKMYRQMHRY
jgi:hypothetical protein